MEIEFQKNEVMSLFIYFLNKDPEDFLLFNSVGYSLQQGYEAQRHVNG